MKPISLTVGAFASECYLVAVPEVLVIDPGDDAAAIETELNAIDAAVSAYLLTHGHADHISALAKLLEKHPAPVYLHEADAAWAFTEANQMPPFYAPPLSAPENMVRLRDGQTLRFGAHTVDVIGTPGHTPGSVCYHFSGEKCLFSGDTLFSGSIGRTDFPGGDASQMQSSLRRLAALAPETVVYPGHGPATTVAEERRINPFMRS